MVRSLTIRDGGVQIVESNEIDMASAKDYDSEIQSRSGFRESKLPIQMVLISYSVGSASPYHLSFFSPRRYSYVEMDAIGFNQVISSTELHSHNTYELCLVRDGTLYQRIEAERHLYPAGSCFLLNRNVMHNEEYDSSFCTVTLSISEDYLKEVLREEAPEGVFAKGYWGHGTDLTQFLVAEMNSIDNSKKSYIDFIPTGSGSEAADLFEEMARTLLIPEPGQSFLIRSQLCRLLYLLNKKELFSTVPVELGTATEGQIFSEIVKTMEKNMGRISRSALSEHLHYSGNYLNRITKKYTGMNLTEYSNSVAMKYAARLLLNTDLTIYEVAEKLSFSNRRYFYEAFEKTYGMTPRKYRVDNKIR
ncbi:MAG: AraC family transcriptional regulator [Oscillospiraceae bacterium]|nr:AraC family transcriptional regulator [Oscillospiraceae bacterium]